MRSLYHVYAIIFTEMENLKTTNKKSEFLSHIIIVLTFLLLSAQTWFKWGSLIVDNGRELWLPAELLKGKVLYKDIVCFFGFLPSYLMATLYSIFGVSINTLAYTGMIITIVTSLTIYKISRFFLNQGLSTLVVINFLFVCAFGQYTQSGIFNFILPYSFSSTLFMTFVVLSTYLFIKFIFSENKKNLISWALFLTLSFLCRPESAFMAWIGFALAGILIIRSQKSNRLKMLAVIAAPVLMAAFFYALFFLTTHSFSAFKESFLASIHVISDIPINKKWFGTDNIQRNLSNIFISFLAQAAIIYVLAMICAIVSKLDKEISLSPTKILLPIITAFVIFEGLKTSHVMVIQYQCITLILLCGSIAYFFQTLNKNHSKHTLASFVLFIVSTMVIYRIFFAVSPYQYGFVLMAMPLICYYIFFASILENTLQQRLKLTPNALSTVSACLFIFMIIIYWKESSSNYKSHKIPIITSRGTIYCKNNVLTDHFFDTANYLKGHTALNSTVAVLPEGVGINFFTDRATPLRHHSFMPQDIGIFGEEKIISEIKSAKIDYIVILSRDTSECGPASFGVDYGQKIKKWIDTNYEQTKLFGDIPYSSKNALGALIMKKKVAKR
jgi:hypothetical protein